MSTLITEAHLNTPAYIYVRHNSVLKNMAE
jgi:hypothetical protein